MKKNYRVKAVFRLLYRKTMRFLLEMQLSYSALAVTEKNYVRCSTNEAKEFCNQISFLMHSHYHFSEAQRQKIQGNFKDILTTLTETRKEFGEESATGKKITLQMSAAEKLREQFFEPARPVLFI